MTQDSYKPTGSASEMDQNYVAFSQQCIDVLPPGVYLIQEIYGAAWQELILEFSSPKQWGKVFKKAVEDRKLVKIRLLMEQSGNPMLSSDRELQYEIANIYEV